MPRFSRKRALSILFACVVTSFEWTTVRELAELICDDVVARNDNRDSHTKSNEPSPFILSYWRPAISLREGIAQLLAESRTAKR